MDPQMTPLPTRAHFPDELGPAWRSECERRINQAEAQIVRRIFREFATGKSPRAIAVGLNREGVSGPLERELLKGVRDLETLKAEALTKRQAATQYQAAYVALKQAQVDWKFLA